MYAGFWRRLAAWILDYIVTLVIIILLAVVLAAAVRSPTATLMTMFFSVIASWLYFASMESSSSRATLGKAALGIRVTDLAGERVSFGRASGRYFSKLFSALTLNIGFAMAGFTDQRQALHDKIASTLVVRKDVTPADIADAPPAPTPSFIASVGLGLFVLLFGPFGLGVLAAIAIPAYQDYTIRAQVSEGLIKALPAKALLADALAQQSDLSQIQDHEAFTTDSLYVSVIDNRAGVLVITFGREAYEGIASKSVELVPGVVTESNEIVWRCGYAPGLAGAQFVADSPGKFTDMPPKYLPTNCR